jgi:hypothetical protein
MLKIGAFLVMGAVAILPNLAKAQSPIPENRVPGFGGTPHQTGSGPASLGSDVGSNVGAGATASPVPDPTPADVGPSVAQSPAPPLVGASRPLPLVKPPPK